MGEMHKAAMNTLKDDDILYELEQAMAVTAFFGIQWPMDNQCHYWNPAPNSVNGLKLSRLRESIRTMWTAMITERSGSSKPKLLCGKSENTSSLSLQAQKRLAPSLLCVDSLADLFVLCSRRWLHDSAIPT